MLYDKITTLENAATLTQGMKSAFTSFVVLNLAKPKKDQYKIIDYKPKNSSVILFINKSNVNFEYAHYSLYSIMNFTISPPSPTLSSANDDVRRIAQHFNATLLPGEPPIDASVIFTMFPDFMLEALIERCHTRGVDIAAAEIRLHFIIADEVIRRVELAGGKVDYPPFIYTNDGEFPVREHWELYIHDRVSQFLSPGVGARA